MLNDCSAERSGLAIVPCQHHLDILIWGKASGNGSEAFDSLVLDELGLPTVDFCKIDIEGHEPKAVRGMDGILRDQKPMILTEVNSYWLEQAGSSGAEYLSTYSAYGYKLYNCDDSMIELEEYREDRMPGVMNVLALHPEGPGELKEK